MSNNGVVAVVLAGGSGTRFGVEKPKQLLKVAGKTVIEHTLDALQNNNQIDEIIVVMADIYISQAKALTRHRYSKLTTIVPGGLDRNQSTKNALAALGVENRKALFHDAVRPFIDDDIIYRCVTALDRYDAVDVVIPSADTIVEVEDVDGDEVISNIPERSYLRRGQTPQGFRVHTLRAAYEKALEDPSFAATDDCSVVLKYLPGTPIVAVNGSEKNIKITYPVDMYIADKLFQLATVASPEMQLAGEHVKERLGGKVLVVFGGSYGIGKDLIVSAQASGALTQSFSRSETETDVRSPEQLRAALRGVFEEYGRIDYVVNTAAVLTRGALVDMSLSGIDEQISVNFAAPALIARESFQYLQRSGGQLLLFTSSSYTRGRAEYSLYSAAKAAIVNLTQALSDEWSPAGIRVNCINPERTKTPMRLKNFGYEAAESLLSSVEVAEAALNVLTSEATGQVVDIRQLR